MGIEDKERRIVQELTAASLDQIIYEDFGWRSRVYLVNGGEFVVKFPRNDEAKREYEHEKSIFELLANVDLNVQIPRLRWAHPNNDYLGYMGIIGQPLDRLDTPPDAAMKKYVGHEIGLFVKQLHSLKLEHAKIMTTKDEITLFQERYEFAQGIIRQYFSSDEQVRLKACVYDKLPLELLAFENDLVLCHGDLGYWNIIVKPDGGLGIIDFGDVGYYDRSKDFIGMADSESLYAALAAYGDDPTLRQKVKLRRVMLNMSDLIFFKDKNDEQGIKKTVKLIINSCRVLANL